MPRVFMLRKNKVQNLFEEKNDSPSCNTVPGKNYSESNTESNGVKHMSLYKRKRRFKYVRSVEEFIELGMIKPVSSNGPVSDDKKKKLSKTGHSKYIAQNELTLWECGVCSKQFKEQYTLVRHLPVHTNDRPFKCEDCGKAFRQASTLCRHKVIHSGVRSFQCSQCFKSFNRSSTLIAHSRTHTEEKQHKCPHCSKAFHQKGNLKNHIFTHTGERPYKCDMCNQGFNQMSNLICHKAHSHVEKPTLSCTVCGKVFPTKYDLHCHDKYKHKHNPKRYSSRLVKKVARNNSAIVDILKQNISTDRVKIHFYLTMEKDTNDNFCTVNQSSPTLPIQSDINTFAIERTDITNFAENVSLVDSSVLNAGEQSAIPPPYCILMQPLFSDCVISTFENTTAAVLLKPAKGLPLFVKIMKDISGKQLLVPLQWTAQDFNLPISSTNAQDKNVKASEVAVPVIGTVTQNNNEDGTVTIQVETTDEKILNNALMEQDLPNENNIAEENVPSDKTNGNDPELWVQSTLLGNKDNKMETSKLSAGSDIFKSDNSPIHEHSHYHKQIEDSHHAVNKINSCTQSKKSSDEYLRSEKRAVEESLSKITSEICALESPLNLMTDDTSINSERAFHKNNEVTKTNDISGFIMGGDLFEENTSHDTSKLNSDINELVSLDVGGNAVLSDFNQMLSQIVDSGPKRIEVIAVEAT